MQKPEKEKDVVDLHSLSQEQLIAHATKLQAKLKEALERNKKLATELNDTKTHAMKMVKETRLSPTLSPNNSKLKLNLKKRISPTN